MIVKNNSFHFLERFPGHRVIIIEGTEAATGSSLESRYFTVNIAKFLRTSILTNITNGYF